MHTTKDIWTDVHEDRQALLGFLELLTPDQWDAPTLCAEWRVRDVVGHLVSATDISVVRALVAIAASGFRMNRYISKDARGRGTAPIATLLEDFRTAAPTRTHPPGQSALSMLEDIVIHQIDIRWPLGQLRPVPDARLVTIASDLVTDRFYVEQKLLRGLRVRATDADWTAGDGPEVAGPIQALVLTLSGRMVALDELDGDGLATLRRRVAT